VSRGHSMRSGRSRCCAKIGPGSRAHKAASVVRRQAIREGETMPMPNLHSGVDPVAHDLPRQVSEPVITWRKVGDRTVPMADYSGGTS
jgi:hypothetical protein